MKFTTAKSSPLSLSWLLLAAGRVRLVKVPYSPLQRQ